MPSTTIFRTACFVFILSSACVAKKAIGQNASVSYPAPVPGAEAIRFLPGNVSSDSIDFGSAFSPNGGSFYFSRSENKRLQIYLSIFEKGKWSQAVPAAFNDPAYSQADPAFSPDGKLYFISNCPVAEGDTSLDYNIWFVSPLPGGSWTEKQTATKLNSDSNEFYISFAKNGELYFSSSREGGFGEEDIYSSKLIKDGFTPPQNLGPMVNSNKSEYDPGISPEGNLLLFASANRPGGFGGADLYFTTRKNKKEWSSPLNLGKQINSRTREYCPYFTPDGKFFFFSGEADVKWISRNFLKNKTGN
ncbi:MAG: PD40 domain-containing protein [Rhizobacter sp.]|nr:PD40 domain-containing protein [Ferruginibacter sp.]